MEAEAILNLLDSYWYDLDFFKGKPTTSNPLVKFPEKPLSNPDIPVLPTIQTKSSKPEKMIPKSQSCDSVSPDSVLLTPKLQTIFSGKESIDVEDSRAEKESRETPTNAKTSPLKGRNRIRRIKKGLSKSLSSLEFKELKGFMDLGFVFSEEDKDSTLASIIPGLQRFGKKFKANDGEVALVDKTSNSEERESDKSGISRPYLSEAWELLEKKRHENSLLNWKVPALNSEIDMKDYLRFWAHSVAKASAVR